ncbi:MAG: hypothetical protein PUP92_30095 [Rhizonema sp. PD38]|nr:hypothetical protein [Rhizonema sp. PD38]
MGKRSLSRANLPPTRSQDDAPRGNRPINNNLPCTDQPCTEPSSVIEKWGARVTFDLGDFGVDDDFLWDEEWSEPKIPGAAFEVGNVVECLVDGCREVGLVVESMRRCRFGTKINCHGVEVE